MKAAKKNDRKTADETSKATPKPAGNKSDPPVEEVGGRDGPEPTRYGDWERKGILSDF